MPASFLELQQIHRHVHLDILSSDDMRLFACHHFIEVIYTMHMGANREKSLSLAVADMDQYGRKNYIQQNWLKSHFLWTDPTRSEGKLREVFKK